MPKFAVRRTSAHRADDEEQPVKGAVREACLWVDRRTFKTPEEHDRRGMPTPWASKGKNHRLTDDGIERDFDHEAWFIDIPDIEELMTLAKREGELVVSPSEGHASDVGRAARPVANFPTIEIYDDWRE